MKLENQVTSLDLSKILKDLGVKQESYFKWEERDNGYLELYHSKVTSCAHKYYSAFTASELLELLPHSIIKNDDVLLLKLNKSSCYYDAPSDLIIFFEDNICNALAKMLIHIIQNNLMDIKQ